VINSKHEQGKNGTPSISQGFSPEAEHARVNFSGYVEEGSTL